MEQKYLDCSREMLDFIQKSPSVFHVIDNIKELFKENGFSELKENEPWKPELSKSYYVVRNDSSCIAFKIGEKPQPKGFHIVAAHSDSPTFKVKTNPQIRAEKQYVLLNTEKYGGMILSSWMDRPLSVAGRIVVSKEGELETRLVNIDRDLLVIPNLAIHMNRDMNKGIEYNPQKDMLPLYGINEDGDEDALLKEVAACAGVAVEAVMGHDLFLYVREPGRILGMDREMLVSPRLDDLQCVYASAKAVTDCIPGEYINICAVFDNEEVGSGTRQGADSTFLEDTLYRICTGLGYERETYLRMVSESFLISADNAHGVHPNHPEKADPTNRPILNGGVVLKYHGSQKYTTDAVSAAKMKSLCQGAGIPLQTYANRSDIAGGSTLGNISTAHVSLQSADIGLPQLAMHAAVETAGSMDTLRAMELFRTFYKE